MELLIRVLALYALGPLAARFGHDSRDRLRSAEERLSAEGFAWGSHAALHIAPAQVGAARPLGSAEPDARIRSLRAHADVQCRAQLPHLLIEQGSGRMEDRRSPGR